MGTPELKRISIEQARRLVSERVTRLEGEAVARDDALGGVLAHDAVAPNELPPFDSSGMDGFAVIASDTNDAPVALKVIGGHPRPDPRRRAMPSAPAVGYGPDVTFARLENRGEKCARFACAR